MTRLILVCGFVLTVVSLAQAGKETTPTRETMREIFAQLQVLLPAAVQRRFDDPGDAEVFRRALVALESRAELLDEHGGSLDPGARLFGQALARDAKRARDFFERGRFDNAAFYVESLVDDCVACHTRVAAVDSAWTVGFLDAEELESLDPLERAVILVATRQFGEALDVYDAVFRFDHEHPGLLKGPLTDYLSVSLRVKRDPSRPRGILKELAARDDVSKVLREDLTLWIGRLESTEPGDLSGTTLERAKDAMKVADEASRYPGDPKALIEYLVASSQLYDLLVKPQASPSDAAEIYFLLGRAELAIARGGWLPRADLYLETAIRIAPGTPVARDAFAVLEEETIAGYTGSGGLRLPPEENSRLSTLRRIAGLGVTDSIDEDPIDSLMNLELSQRGARLFADHCAFCHGASAEGNGPAARTLMTAPKDLTRIAARRDGEFPSSEIRALVDGRDPVGGHRSPEMPRWGAYWAEPEKLDAVVAFLRTLQR